MNPTMYTIDGKFPVFWTLRREPCQQVGNVDVGVLNNAPQDTPFCLHLSTPLRSIIPILDQKLEGMDETSIGNRIARHLSPIIVHL
jgi:hypothetical protein